MSRTDPQFNLRIPQELRDRVVAAAQANKRSATAEILARLESTFAEENRVLNMDLEEYAAEVYEAVDAEATAAQAPELARRLTAVEHQLQRIIALLTKE